MEDSFDISCITIDEAFNSVFSDLSYQKVTMVGMLLTERIDAQNFRLRESSPGYCSAWHVAGDPTLIAIQQGVLRIILRDGSHRDFQSGDILIAQDHLPEGVLFDPGQHGHKAEVLGKKTLKAVHIKLSERVIL